MWGGYSWGLALICGVRQFQWPLLAVSLLASVGVMGLVLGQRHSARWMLGLVPVLLLWWVGLSFRPLGYMRVAELAAENSPMVTAAEATVAKLVGDEDSVVGVVIGGQAIAYPYDQLFLYPVVVQNVRQARAIILWTPDANRVTAAAIDRNVRASELEIVSMPANALLLYNSRNGQFINGLTGQTTGMRQSDRGKTPNGFERPLRVVKTTFGQWKRAYPQSLVTNLPDVNVPAVPRPARAILPRFPMPTAGEMAAATTRPAAEEPAKLDPSHWQMPVVVIETSPPVAMLPSDVSDIPLNVNTGPTPLVVVRDPSTRALRAFERQVGQRFAAPANLARTGGEVVTPPASATVMVDVATGVGYAINGRPVGVAEGVGEGRIVPLVGVPIDENLPWDVLHHHIPTLRLYLATAADMEALPVLERPVVRPPAPTQQPARRRTTPSNRGR
jgi:hypothetical protein